MDIYIEPFTTGDEVKLFKLLSNAALPTKDITTEKFHHFLVARDSGKRIIGTIGYECRKPYGLLRSLVIHPSYQGSGVGKQLVRSIESLTKQKGINTLYLLTTTATAFFLNLNYKIMSRDFVPAAILETEEFNSICPSSAICMYKTIEDI